jgi:hypothetical protein
MRQITGYVLIRETSAGIPNLVVKAFDSGGAPDVLRKHAPTVDVMKQLGRPISSVFTNEEGRFSFSTEDLEFPGNEPRPDLIVVVFAPEDILDPTHPYPKNPEEQVLYMSIVPRIDAGAQEAFVIRLSREVVSGRGIDTEENRFASALDQHWNARDIISESLNARNKVELKRKAAARKEAVERTKNLHAVPLALRGHELLVVGKASLSRTVKVSGVAVTKAEQLQQKVVEDGLKALDKGLKALDKSESKPSMRLYLSNDDLAYLKLKLRNGVLSGKPTYQLLKSKALSLLNGVDLVRVRGMNNPSPDVLEARYLSPAPQPKTSSPANPSGRKAKGAKTSDVKRKR